MADDPWYRSDLAALETTICEATQIQPHMRLCDDGSRVCFSGRFEIDDGEEPIEAFAIEIELSPKSPRALPLVRETGGRIPRDRDRHHVEEDGALCVVLPDHFFYHHPSGMTLAEFLRGPLRHHLAGQATVLRGQPWPADEWAHGAKGVVQFYQEVLEESDLRRLLDLLASEATKRSKRQMVCPCGSGKKRRHCHGKILRALGQGPNFVSAIRYLLGELKKGAGGQDE